MHASKPLAQPQHVVYNYDGGLIGFYSCVHQSVYAHELPVDIVPIHLAQPSLLPQRNILTDDQKASKVRASIPKKISPRALQLVETVFLCALAQKEIKLLRFLLLGYQKGFAADMLGHPDVAPLLHAERHLLGEKQLLMGFVRFTDYGGMLAATITPKNFILPFLAGHFCDRYSGENFIIYDKTHRHALLYENRHARILPVEDMEFAAPGEKEEEFRALWKRFYDTVAIEARINPRLRMTHMPKRYWPNMFEMADQ